MAPFQSTRMRSSAGTMPTDRRRTRAAACLLVIGSLLASPITAAADQEPATPPQQTNQNLPRMLSRLKTLPGTLEFPVIDAALLRIGKRVVLLGGMDNAFQATPAVQLRQENGIWRPVGVQMLRARIRPRATALPDGRVFVWGGDSGSVLEETLEPERNGEVLDPRVAGSARLITPPDEAEWPMSSGPCLLGDGTVALAAGSAVQRFDPVAMEWLDPIPVPGTATDPGLCLIAECRVLLTATDPETKATRLHDVDCTTGVVTTWPASLPRTIPGAQLLPLPDERVLVIGWRTDEGGPPCSADSYLIACTDRTVQERPGLPHDPDGPEWLHAATSNQDVLVLMSPGFARTDEVQGYLLKSRQDGSLRTWRLISPPLGRFQMILGDEERRFELFGGYRYQPRAPRRRVDRILQNATSALEYGTGPVGD